MTMPIIENWADISGELLDSYPSLTSDGFVTLEIKLKDAKEVKGYRNLLADKRGEIVRVNVPESAWKEMAAKAGTNVKVRARMATSRKLFAHPEHLNIE